MIGMRLLFPVDGRDSLGHPCRRILIEEGDSSEELRRYVSYAINGFLDGNHKGSSVNPNFTLVATSPLPDAGSMSISLPQTYLSHAFPPGFERHLNIMNRIDYMMGTLLTDLSTGRIASLNINFESFR